MPHSLREALEAASRGWSGDQPSDAMLTATRAFLAAATEDQALLGELAASMAGQEPGIAAWLAITSGTATERGAPAGIAGAAVFGLLRSWLPKLPRWSEDAEEAPEPTAEQAALLPLFQHLCQSTVTHLARLPALREAMVQDVVLLEQLGELQCYSHGAVWVREALLKTSGTVILLHPPSGTGLQLRYTNVSNCFHLFSLLQTAVGEGIPGGREPDPVVARVARGQGTEPVTDEAWWHYGSPHSEKADLGASIWGEGNVRDIPRVDGAQVILAWPPLLQSRVWDAGFLGPHLEAMPADAVLGGALTTEEVATWLQRLDIDPRAGGSRTKWWKFW